MQTRNAASVLPDPVGAEINVVSPARICGQPASCGSVGVPNFATNHSCTMGCAHASDAIVTGSSATIANCSVFASSSLLKIHTHKLEIRQPLQSASMPYRLTVRGVTHSFDDLRTLLAKASPPRSGDELAGLAAESAQQRAIAQMTLADVPLATFENEAIIPYEDDDVTRLIIDSQDKPALAPVAALTVGEFRDWLLSDEATGERISALAPGLMPEMLAAVSKLMRVQDLIAVARKVSVVTRFRTTVGLPGCLSTRLQPNHPTDDPLGIAASMLDGLLLGSGDAVIGINPVADNPTSVTTLLRMIDHVRTRYAIPTQSCVLAHVTTQMEAMQQGAPLDLLFQSIAGTQAANASFGVTLTPARRSPRDGEGPQPRRPRRRKHLLLRDRSGQRSLRQCTPRRRPADLRGPSLRRRPPLSPNVGQHRRRLHRPRVPL